MTDTESTYKNTDEAEIRGLRENSPLISESRLTDWNSSLRLFTNFTKIFNAEKKTSTGKQDIHNVADFKISYGLEYDDGHFFDGRITARYVGHMRDTDWVTAG